MTITVDKLVQEQEAAKAATRVAHRKRISEASYEDALLAHLRLEGKDDLTIEIMKIWLTLSPEQKKIAKAKLMEMDSEAQRILGGAA